MGEVARQNEGHPLNLNFRKTASNLCSMQYLLGKYSERNLFIIELQFKFNWAA
jgi:hypothetical protein